MTGNVLVHGHVQLGAPRIVEDDATAAALRELLLAEDRLHGLRELGQGGHGRHQPAVADGPLEEVVRADASLEELPGPRAQVPHRHPLRLPALGGRGDLADGPQGGRETLVDEELGPLGRRLAGLPDALQATVGPLGRLGSRRVPERGEEDSGAGGAGRRQRRTEVPAWAAAPGSAPVEAVVAEEPGVAGGPAEGWPALVLAPLLVAAGDVGVAASDRHTHGRRLGRAAGRGKAAS
mmetsp:Transcript_96910/g.235588  ORF Transcript_96910/g.235588 Transcript_96910/m.235588 type:complete len:236 (+) Transcript_96910:470-1177(+)